MDVKGEWVDEWSQNGRFSAVGEWAKWVPGCPRTEKSAQKMLIRHICSQFPEWSFVGFYDKKNPADAVIQLGQWQSEEVVPCKQIVIGKGQCG